MNEYKLTPEQICELEFELNEMPSGEIKSGASSPLHFEFDGKQITFIISNEAFNSPMGIM